MIGIEKARTEAKRVIKAIIEGEDRGGPQSYERMSDEWFKRHVKKTDRKLRSAPISGAIWTSTFFLSGAVGISTSIKRTRCCQASRSRRGQCRPGGR